MTRIKTIVLSCLFGSLLIAFAVQASAIKTWTTGEVIRASDLNAVLTHLHSNLGHGHGAVITNSDIASNAGIAHSAMATPALLPKAWAVVNASCTATPCTITAFSGVTSIAWLGTGLYTVTLSTARSDTSYGVLITPTGAAGGRSCLVETIVSTTSFSIDCYDLATPSLANTGFTVMVLDNT